MAQAVNPYVAGPPLQGEEGFFGRREVLGWAERGLRNPANNSLVLFGQRCIGKTSLLLQVQRTLPSTQFLPVYFDLQDQTTRPLGLALADLAQAIAERAGLAPPDRLNFDDQGHYFLQSFLPRLYAELPKNQRPVFLLDEFGVLEDEEETQLPHEENLAINAFYRFTRRVINRDPRPAFVFTVGRRVDDLNVDFTAKFKASLVHEIWLLERESAEGLILQANSTKQMLTPGALNFTDRAVKRILSLTGGHPYLTQSLCRQIWERAYAGEESPITPPRVDVVAVEDAVTATLAASAMKLDWIWDGLSLPEKIYTTALAQTVEEGEAATEKQGLQTLTDYAARLRVRRVERAPRDLVRRRVLALIDGQIGEQPEEPRYRFAVELYRRWVCQYRPLADVKGELDRVDPLAEELFDIGQGFLRRHRWETATRYFRDALEANPHHFKARLLLGEALLELGQIDEAVDELERAYKMDQEDGRASLTQALIIQSRKRGQAGDEDGSLKACKRALRISPENRTAQEIRDAIWLRRLEAEAHSYEEAERWAEAASTYEQLTAHAPDEKSRRVWETAQERCRIEARLTRLFAEGSQALEENEWRKAQRALAAVVHERPDYGSDGQLAARLLLRATLQNPTRHYTPLLAFAFFVIIGIAASLLYFKPWREFSQPPPVALPAHWAHVRTQRIDANHDGELEWLTLYRFDLWSADGQTGAPIGGIVYHTYGDPPSALVPHKLLPQGRDYLCECACSVEMEDVLSGLTGPELTVRDQCDGATTRLNIFHWDKELDKYVPQGHFEGSHIRAQLDQVTVDRRLPHRAQLTLRQVYHPRDQRTYYAPGQGILVAPDKYELAFYQAAPEDVSLSPYPEKTVLAFYNHYTDADISAYFTEQGWDRVEQCAAGRCGCDADRSEVKSVRVVDLQVKEESYPEDVDPHSEGYMPDRALVEVHVVCELRDDDSENPQDRETPMNWRLVRQGERWKLDNAEVIQNEDEIENGE
jgi:tetratricopeptide (TPR) repeat protein